MASLRVSQKATASSGSLDVALDAILSLKVSANLFTLSGSDVLQVLMQGRPFVLAWWILCGFNLTLLATSEWSVSQSALW